MDDLKVGDVFLYRYLTGDIELLVIRSITNYYPEYDYWMVGLAFIDMNDKAVAFSIKKEEFISSASYQRLTLGEAELAKVLYG